MTSAAHPGRYKALLSNLGKAHGEKLYVSDRVRCVVHACTYMFYREPPTPQFPVTIAIGERRKKKCGRYM